MLKFLYKWLYCSWKHRKYRCYPVVWSEEIAIENDMLPYRPNYWHCNKCHPCSEELDKLLKENL